MSNVTGQSAQARNDHWWGEYPAKLVAIVGQTASGKSGLALDLAKEFEGEIINADSWQIYKGMDVGTAKPTEEERNQVPHHLLDIVEPNQKFTAADYKDLAIDKIKEVAGRDKLPMLVGGSGLYLDGVLFDYSFMPKPSPEQRQKLNSMSKEQLIKKIMAKDISLKGVDTNNKRRLVRLLESEGSKPTSSEQMRPNTLALGIKISRTQLRENIEKRTEVMFRKGLKHEVQELAEEFGWDNEAMKGIGYRQLRPYFEGNQSNSETKRSIVKNTLRLAKKQRTWFKRNPEIQWIKQPEQAFELVEEFLGMADNSEQ